ncbi:glycosyltransferase [Candidatus Sumerlaeota bacterium]|nr:glycosyltransferase [Candidatus Sumerlaeota bacterium]
MTDAEAENRRIRVFYVVERLARAGTELHLLRVLRHLNRERFEPILCCLNRSMCESELIPGDMPVHLLDARWNLLHPSTLRVYGRLHRLIRETQPDVVHSFLFVSNVLGSLAARRAGVRSCVSSRGRMGIEWDANFFHRLTQRRADRRIDRILCKTEAMRREIAEHERVPIDKIEVIPNGVDTLHFAFEPDGRAEARRRLAQEFGIPAEGPLVLAVSNLKPIKNHATLVEAAEILTRRSPTVQIAIVGQGESAEDLREIVRTRKLDRTVHLPGHSRDVRVWMRAADVFAAASLSEGMPNALLEAMAMGVAPVLSDIPGHRETALDNAWYFPPKDARALSDALGEALDFPEKRAERVRANHERVVSSLSLEAMVRRIETVYEELKAGKRER